MMWILYLVMIPYQLNDDADTRVKILDGDHPHDVRRVLGVRVTRPRVGHDETSFGFLKLFIT